MLRTFRDLCYLEVLEYLQVMSHNASQGDAENANPTSRPKAPPPPLRPIEPMPLPMPPPPKLPENISRGNLLRLTSTLPAVPVPDGSDLS